MFTFFPREDSDVHFCRICCDILSFFLFQISKSKCDILDVIRQKRKKYQGSKWDIMFSNQLITQIRTYNYGFRKVTLFGYSWVYDNSDRSSMNVKTCMFINNDCRIQRSTYLLLFSKRVYPFIHDFFVHVIKIK